MHILICNCTDKVCGCSLNMFGGEVVRSCDSCPEPCAMQKAQMVHRAKCECKDEKS